jgi:hypothetical protein
MQTVDDKELERQYRVLGQMLSIHTFLRDRYHRLALASDLLLLACSVVFCATAFASDDFFVSLGISATSGKFVLKIASVIAFLASLVALRFNWKAKSGEHSEAQRRLTKCVALFRSCHNGQRSWRPECAQELSRAYWDTMDGIVEIPASKFVPLKAKHLRKVEVSKLLDVNPGCPVLVLRGILFTRFVKNILKKPPAPSDGV